MISIIASSAPGLSPLARGTLTRCYPVPFFQRFIPAGAGNTRLSSFSIQPPTVYPRWRGEHDCFRARVIVEVGLSPLARGTRDRRCYAELLERFIPAGAGNTRAYRIADNKLPVYPRWRGEHQAIMSLPENSYGLSPLARGTRVYQRHYRQ